MLLYGFDSLFLHVDQFHKLSVALDTAIRHCFLVARNASVRNVLYFVGCVPMLDERKFKLIKSWCSNSEVISLCARKRSTDAYKILVLSIMFIVTCLVIERHKTFDFICLPCWRKLKSHILFCILYLCIINLLSFRMISAAYIISK